MALLYSAPVAAQARQQFNLPEGDAAQRVQTLAAQSGVQVIAPNADLAGVRVPAVQGQYTPAEALRTMLAGTGLQVQPGAGNALVITRATALAAAQGDVAAADEDDDDDQNIVVTGTRIIREGVDTIRAATVTDEAEFERRGYTNVIQALSDTPGFSAPANSEVQATQATLGIAQSFSNFFGLGSQRTLTLVNGRRFVSSNSVSGIGGGAVPGSQVDLNLMPVGLVDRTETVAIGGAPVYGSDAIAGTVNVILKDDYEGLEITGQARISERGDAANQSIRGLWGANFMEGRGNIVLGAEYVRQEAIRFSERFPALALLPTATAANRTDGLPALIPIEQVFALFTEGGLPFVSGALPTDQNLITANGQDVSATNPPLQFAGGGALVPYLRGANYFGNSGGLLRNGGEGVNPGDHLNLVAPNERYLLNALGNFDVTPWLNLFFEASYAHTEAVELSELFQFAAPGVGGPLLSFSIDNPFLPAATRSLLIANGVGTTFRLNRNLNDIADSQPARTELDVWRIVVGARGDFNVWGEDLTWDMAYNYGHSRNEAEFNQINLTRFLAAIDVIRDNAGNIVCRSGGNCIPLNIFGVNSFSPEAAAAVLDQGIGISRNALEEITANLGGRLPFGLVEPISFSIGYAHRTETGSFEGNDIINNGLFLLAATPTTPPPWPSAFPDAPKRGFNTDEVYGETVIPLVDDELGWPLIRRLEFEGAVRYVSHSTAGGDITWSAGGRLEPRIGSFTDGLMIRGVFTRSIRAPNIVELFLNPTPVLRAANDVCAPARIDAGPNPTVRRANCTAALAEFGLTPATFNPTTNTRSPQGGLLGNPDLDNEKANSWSVGFVWQPPAIPRLRINVDYSEIRVTNAITRFTLITAQSACYDSPNFLAEPACAAFDRLDATELAAQEAATGVDRTLGDIADNYRETYFNTQLLDFAGIIGEIDYRVPLPALQAGPDPAMLRFNLRAFNIRRFRTQTSSVSPINVDLGELGTPEWRINGRVGLVVGPFDFDVNVIWTDSTVLDLVATPEDIAPEINNVPSYTLVNAALGVRLDENFFLQFSVRNLFDKDVPFPGVISRAFGTFDPIGRTYTATASVRF